jgi:AraC-like DNA-binding protein
MATSQHRIYGTGRTMPDPTWHVAPHSHSFHELIAIVRGQLFLDAEGRRIIGKAGDLLFYRAGFVHEERSNPRLPVETVFLAFETGDRLSGVPVLTHDQGRRVHQLIHWIGEEEQARRSPEFRSLLLDALVVELRRLGDARPDPWLEEMLAFLRENLARPLTLDALAHRGRMSKFAFVRRFKRLSGRTPMKELRLTRLDQARTLLLTTDLPLKAIADAVGIGDEYQLSKLFRSQFRLTPRTLRIRARHAT